VIEKMKKIQAAVSALSLLAGGLVVQQAFARTIAAQIGRATTASDAPCFNYAVSSVTNTCSSAKQFSVWVPMDTPGGKSLTVVGTGTVTGCSYVAYDVNGSATAFTPLTLNVPAPINAPGASFMVVSCNVGASGTGRFVGVDFQAP
jgi:hypothetical protein